MGVEPTRRAKRASPDLKSGRSTGMQSPSVFDWLGNSSYRTKIQKLVRSCLHEPTLANQLGNAGTIEKLQYLYGQISANT